MNNIDNGLTVFLKDTFGPRVTFDDMERRVYGHDVASIPAMVKPFIGKTKPGASGIAVQLADGHALPYQHSVFDAAWSSFCVRNLRDLRRAMTELRRVVRPGGRLVVLEFFRPRKERAFFDGFYNARVLPLLGRMVTGDAAAYRYLPDSIARFLSRAEFEGLLREVGFSQVRGRDLFPAGVASLVVAE